MNKTYTMNNGVQIPAVGFGTYKAADGKSADVIKKAIGSGYRYFDTASLAKRASEERFFHRQQALEE